jgi:hypothetical protein
MEEQKAVIGVGWTDRGLHISYMQNLDLTDPITGKQKGDYGVGRNCLRAAMEERWRR